MPSMPRCHRISWLQSLSAARSLTSALSMAHGGSTDLADALYKCASDPIHPLESHGRERTEGQFDSAMPFAGYRQESMQQPQAWLVRCSRPARLKQSHVSYLELAGCAQLSSAGSCMPLLHAAASQPLHVGAHVYVVGSIFRWGKAVNCSIPCECPPAWPAC